MELKHQTYIKSDAFRVFVALTSISGWNAWSTSHCVLDLRPGGEIHFYWDDFGPDLISKKIQGEVLDYEESEHWTFLWYSGSDSDPTTVEISFMPSYDGTIVRVFETGFSNSKEGIESLARNAAFWGEALTLLKFYLEHNVKYDHPKAGEDLKVFQEVPLDKPKRKKKAPKKTLANENYLLPEEKIKELIRDLEIGGFKYYVNVISKEVLQIPDFDLEENVDNELFYEDFNKLETYREEYVKLERMNSDQFFRMMEDFAFSLENNKTKPLIFESLRKDDYWEAFSLELDRHPDVKQLWVSFKEEAYIKHIQVQLKVND